MAEENANRPGPNAGQPEARDDNAKIAANNPKTENSNLRADRDQNVEQPLAPADQPTNERPVVPTQEGTVVGEQPLTSGEPIYSTDPEENAELRAEHDEAVRRAAQGERADEDVERDRKDAEAAEREESSDTKLTSRDDETKRSRKK